MIKTFIFDLGKVVVPFEIEPALKHFEKACDIKGVELRRKADLIEENSLYHQGKVSADKLFEAFKSSLSLRMNFNEFTIAWNSIFSPETILSEEFIENLSNKYRLIILSDTNELHFKYLTQNYPIFRHFDDFVLSHEVGAVKPSPKMYEAAVKTANCLPQECLFTDDKLENVLGAREFGINAVQFLSREQFENYLIEEGLYKSG